MSLSVSMEYGKTVYMITYLVSLETREMNYLINTNKYHKSEDTPRHIPVEIHLSPVFYTCMVCFQAFDKFSRYLEKVFHVQILLKIYFNPKDF